MSLRSAQTNRGPGRMRRLDKAKKPSQTLKRLLTYFLPYKQSLFIIFALVLISTITTFAGPYFMGIAIDDYIVVGNLPGLLQLALIMLVIYLINWAAQAGSAFLTARLSQRALKSIRQDLFDHLQTLSIKFFDENPHGDLMSRLTNDIDAINQAVAQNITQLFSSILTLSCGIIAMFI